MSPADPTFESLSPEFRQRALNAKAVHDFFQSEIAPKLLASAGDRERFAAAPTEYLISAGAPVLADLSTEHRASMDAVLAGPPPVGDAVGCWICTKGYEVLITTIIVIGVVIIEALLIALVAVITAATASALTPLAAAFVAFLIDEVGMTIGAEVLGPMVEQLAILICNNVGGCP
jgi:hypothetical protein